MLNFWKNPEFIRHRRSELRRSRALGAAAVVIVLCILVGLACWAERDSEMTNLRRYTDATGRPTAAEIAQIEARNPVEFSRLFYRSLMYGQTIVLTFWVLFACAQGVSGERERKTWDFQRTTRLRPAELLIGKLFGEPVLAYFVVLCCLPIALIAGLKGEISFLAIISTYILIFSAALFVGLTGLWISSLFESRSRGVGLIGTLGLYAMVASAQALGQSPFPGSAGLSPFTGVEVMTKGVMTINGPYSPTLFGWTVPWVVMSLVLYISFGAWFVIMLTRNLKKDREDLRLLSRWQVVACVAFLNFLAYGLFHKQPWLNINMTQFATVIVTMNACILLAMGLATLTPHERLKVWSRNWHAKQAGLFAEDGLPWPWLAFSAFIAYGLLVWGLSAWKNQLGFDPKAFQSGAVQLLAVLIFVTRDVLFIQWCTLTRMRASLVKGVLYLGLYYIASVMVSIVLGVQSEQAAWRFANVTTPAGIFGSEISGFHFPATVFVGMAIQLAAIMGLLMVINRRLARPATVPSVAMG